MDATGRWERTDVQAHVRLAAWLRSPLFRSYLRRFILLWVAGKIANGATAAVLEIQPFAFRPGTELVTFAFEIGVLVLIIKRANEDILLGNLGMSVAMVIAPLAVVQVVLSALVALLAT